MEQLEKQLTSVRDEISRGSHLETNRGGSDMEQTIDNLRRTSLEVELAAKEKEVCFVSEDFRFRWSTYELVEICECYFCCFL